MCIIQLIHRWHRLTSLLLQQGGEWDPQPDWKCTRKPGRDLAFVHWSTLVAFPELEHTMVICVDSPVGRRLKQYYLIGRGQVSAAGRWTRLNVGMCVRYATTEWDPHRTGWIRMFGLAWRQQVLSEGSAIWHCDGDTSFILYLFWSINK